MDPSSKAYDLALFLVSLRQQIQDSYTLERTLDSSRRTSLMMNAICHWKDSAWQGRHERRVRVAAMLAHMTQEQALHTHWTDEFERITERRVIEHFTSIDHSLLRLLLSSSCGRMCWLWFVKSLRDSIEREEFHNKWRFHRPGPWAQVCEIRSTQTQSITMMCLGISCIERCEGDPSRV